jgi:adenylylsulfate kinase
MDPCVLWFYGLSGAGKTSLSEALAAHFKDKNIPCLRLDGDDIRGGLSRDLQFSTADRAENVRRTAEVARLACQQGLVVLVALITPTEGLRAAARGILHPLPFHDIFLDCDYQTSANRDVKGLYARAEAGQIRDFTGKDSAFETPSSTDLRVNTHSQSLDQSLAEILDFLFIPPH